MTNVAILIFDGVELVDMNDPVDVFLHANGFIDEKYSIFTVAENSATIGGGFFP